MNKKIGEYTYKVEPFDADFNGRLSWNVLGKRILSAASYHAGERGFEKMEVEGTPYLWVLSRLVFEIEKYPQIGDTYTISTWIKSYFRYFTERCFDLCDEKGNVQGRVLSIWAMINSKTRQPVELTNLFGETLGQYIETGREFQIQQFGHLRVNNIKLKGLRSTYYNDIDTNGHVNSINYIEYLLDSFPLNNFKKNDVSHLEMNYTAESFCGDELHIFIDEKGAGKYVAEIRKQSEDNKSTVTVCKCGITFRSKES